MRNARKTVTKTKAEIIIRGEMILKTKVDARGKPETSTNLSLIATVKERTIQNQEATQPNKTLVQEEDSNRMRIDIRIIIRTS